MMWLDASLGNYIDDRLLPMQHVPFATSLTDPKEQQGGYSLAPAPSPERESEFSFS